MDKNEPQTDRVQGLGFMGFRIFGHEVLYMKSAIVQIGITNL